MHDQQKCLAIYRNSPLFGISVVPIDTIPRTQRRAGLWRPDETSISGVLKGTGLTYQHSAREALLQTEQIHQDHGVAFGGYACLIDMYSLRYAFAQGFRAVGRLIHIPGTCKCVSSLAICLHSLPGECA